MARTRQAGFAAELTRKKTAKRRRGSVNARAVAAREVETTDRDRMLRKLRVEQNIIKTQIWNETTSAANLVFSGALRSLVEQRMRQNPGTARQICESYNKLCESHGYGWNKIDNSFATLCGGLSKWGTRSRAERLNAEREFSRYLYNQNTHGRGIIGTIVTYTVGPELKVNITYQVNDGGRAARLKGSGQEVADKQKVEIEERARAAWQDIYDRPGTQFEVRASECVQRALTDGDALSHVFPSRPRADANLSEAAAVNADQTTGPIRAVWRFGESEDLKTPSNRMSIKPDDVTAVDHGVEYKLEDPEHVVGYWFEGYKKHKEPVPASEIHHLKIGSYLNAHRGVPFLTGHVAERCKQYGEFLDYRIFLAKARTAIAAVIYRNSAAPNDKSVVENARTRTENRRQPDGRVKQVEKYVLDVASLITLNKEDKVEFLSPNLEAEDSQHDGRAILCSIAAGVGLPEYMVTGDSQQANYASQQIAEARGVATLMVMQRMFLRHIAGIVKRMVIIEMAQDTLEEIAELEKNLRVELTGPTIVVRNRLEEAKSEQIKVLAKLTSRKASMRRLGEDPEAIMQEIAEEATESPDDQADDPLTEPLTGPRRRNRASEENGGGNGTAGRRAGKPDRKPANAEA